MKSIKFISALALVLGLAACDNFELPNPPGQTYPAPDGYLTDSDIEIVPVAAPISLPQANQDNKDVVLGSVSKLENFPQEYTLAVYAEFSGTEDFAKSTVLPTTIVDKQLTINPDVLNGAVQKVITKKPGTYDLYTRFVAYATLGNTNLRIGGPTATYGDTKLVVTTFDPVKVVEDSYYVVPCTAAGTPEFDKAIKMNNTAGEGLSGYDAPEFAVRIEIPEGVDYHFVIAPLSAVEAKDNDGILGCNPDETGMAGKLGSEYKVGLMPIAGSVLITINAERDSYSISYAFDVLYPISGTTSPSKAMLLYTDNYINYYGVTAINQQWTLYTQPDKKGVIFKLNPEVEPVINETGLEISGEITSSSEGTLLQAPIKGNCLYYVDANLFQLTYSMKALQTMSVIGAGNDWNLEKAAAEASLEHSKDFKVWTAKDVKLKDEFKVNCNGAWDYDFGGVQVEDPDGKLVYNLNFKGSNMPVEEGTYDVEINFSAKPYVLTLTKK